MIARWLRTNSSVLGLAINLLVMVIGAVLLYGMFRGATIAGIGSLERQVDRLERRVERLEDRR